MKAKKVNEGVTPETKVEFVHKNNPGIRFFLFKDRSGRITHIDNGSFRGRFPFFVG